MNVSLDGCVDHMEMPPSGPRALSSLDAACARPGRQPLWSPHGSCRAHSSRSALTSP